jgi:hypothetical protein
MRHIFVVVKQVSELFVNFLVLKTELLSEDSHYYDCMRLIYRDLFLGYNQIIVSHWIRARGNFSSRLAGVIMRSY